jgi:hypothetical protein
MINRLNARAQQLALRRLKNRHRDEYAQLYTEARVEVFAEAEVEVPPRRTG